jgi:glutathione synthase/RimK-type ligase-like ATP-grasp enzyme
LFVPSAQQRTIGFLTSGDHRNLTKDDLILAAALERRGIRVAPVVWTEMKPDSLACDLLLVRSVWDYHLRPQDFMRWIDEASGRITVLNPPEMIRWNMDKRYLRQIETAGFRVPKTVFLTEGTETNMAQVMHAGGFGEAVVKPTISASAYETRRIKPATRQQNEWLDAMLTTRPMMVQEFIPEIQSGGEWSLIFAGMEFTHAAHKIPKAGDFRVQEEHGGLHKRRNPPKQALAMAQEILQRFAPEAVYCRVDLVMRGEHATLMELELIEPLLHFELAPEAADVMAAKLKQLIADQGN